MADSGEKFRLVSRYTMQRKKVVSRSRWSRYINVGSMHRRLNGKPLEEVDCFKYLGLQVVM